MTVNVTPEGSGNVKIDGTTYISFPAYRSVPDNSTVWFEAIPADGYEFVSWGGPLSGDKNPISYFVTCDTSVFAIFRVVDNKPPVANAGGDQAVVEGSTVTLDGSASDDSDGEIVFYQWSQTGGTTVELSDSTAVQPTFTAPDTGAEGETLTFELTVEDDGGLEDFDTCIVTVRDTVEPPPNPPANEPPVANAGEDQNAIEGTVVTLDGSASFDPNNDIASYQWTQTGGTYAELSDETAVQPTFIAPNPSIDGEILTFELIVTDSQGLEDADNVNISLLKTEWVEISGTIMYGETPLCAMVLANGQYMFTCDDSIGLWDLEVPLDENGEITLYGFCSGFLPFRTTISPGQAQNFDISMNRPTTDNREMEITVQIEPGPGTINPDYVRISGTVTFSDGTPLCAMVLANGQSMFSCGNDLGTFALEVPLDENGEITLFGFCSGFAPYMEVFKP